MAAWSDLPKAGVFVCIIYMYSICVIQAISGIFIIIKHIYYPLLINVLVADGVVVA